MRLRCLFVIAFAVVSQSCGRAVLASSLRFASSSSISNRRQHDREKWWPFSEAESANDGDLPLLPWRATRPGATVDVPGEGPQVDEMESAPAEIKRAASLVQGSPVRPRYPSLLIPAGAVRAPHGARADSRSTDHLGYIGAPARASVELMSPAMPAGVVPIDEYDVAREDDAVDDQVGTEAGTLEDSLRMIHGDVRHPLKRQPVGSPRLTALLHGGRRKYPSHHAQAKASMREQCVAFSTSLKIQNLKGEALVRVWKGTCSPAVTARTATPAYVSMCEKLADAVREFADRSDWTPTEVCDVVLRTFRGSKVGASPLKA